MEKYKKTWIVDIDGTLLRHNGGLEQALAETPSLLPGVLKKWEEWDKAGDNVIILTGRRESMRRVTEDQLNSYNLRWDQLIMGVGGGQRILLNDYKPHSKEPTAVAICVERNIGLAKVDLKQAIESQKIAFDHYEEHTS